MNSLSDIPAPLSTIEVERATFDARSLGEWHRHPVAQLIYPSRGVMILHTRRGQWVVPPQQGCWLPPDHEHRVETSVGFEMYSVYCTGSILRRLPAEPGLTSVSPLMREVIFAIADTDAGRRRRHLAFLFADEMAMKISPALLIPSVTAPRIVQIAEALDRDPGDRRSIEAWSELFHMSSRSLARLFQRDVGVGFTTFRNQLRLKAALLRLAQGESVTSIALELGFGTASNFIRAFRELTGTTPARYFAAHP